MSWYSGYAECIICKDQNGPWIEINQKFYCEDCYEKLKKGEIKNENRNKRRKANDDTRN